MLKKVYNLAKLEFDWRNTADEILERKNISSDDCQFIIDERVFWEVYCDALSAWKRRAERAISYKHAKIQDIRLAACAREDERTHYEDEEGEEMLSERDKKEILELEEEINDIKGQIRQEEEDDDPDVAHASRYIYNYIGYWLVPDE